MKFTKEELTEMRKLAGIDHVNVDFRRPQDMLTESHEEVTAEPVEEEELPTHEMPKKGGLKTWASHGKGSRTPLTALLAKHKSAKEASTGRSVPTEVKGEKDDVVPPKS